jgi:hypothetical protein
MRAELTEVFDKIGMHNLKWSSPDGSSVMLLPYGGRILALSSSMSDQNFFWTHPALQSVETARTFYQSSAWHNSGGDRTWLAPEVEFFFPNHPHTNIYLQPPQLESVSYEVAVTSDRVSMVNRFTIPMYASKTKAQLELSKEITQAVNPLLDVSPKLAARIDYAGYTLRTKLSLDNGATCTAPIGLWNLLQLPHGGEMTIPTCSLATPVVYMGPISDDDLRVVEHTIRYRMVAQGEQKFGVHAAFSTGITAYLYSSGNLLSLVIRSFAVSSSGKYVDVPTNGTEREGCAVQSCNINSGLGAFSEMEYHTPAIGGPVGCSQRVDESQLWAFRGSHSTIMEVARLLVSPEI